MSTFEYEAPFTPSRPRKKRKNRAPQERPDHAVALARTVDELVASGWAAECTQLLRDALQELHMPPPAVLCLGLGSPTASRDARAQLAFLLAACDALALERGSISAYDPVFTDDDEQLLAAARVRRLAENRDAAYALAAPTLMYMPHCDLRLYENLLAANDSAERLPRVLLIANRLREYMDSLPSHKLHAEYPCVSRIAPQLQCIPLPPCAAFPNAFNNLAVQFASASASDASPATGVDTAAPTASHDDAITAT